MNDNVVLSLFELEVSLLTFFPEETLVVCDTTNDDSSRRSVEYVERIEMSCHMVLNDWLVSFVDEFFDECFVINRYRQSVALRNKAV